MKLTRIVPLASLATVAGVALSALVVDPPADFPFTEPPAGEAPAPPALGLGDAILHGLAVDGDGAPVAGVGVTTKSGPRATTTRSRADGTFELTDLRPGPTRLFVQALGHEAIRVDLDPWPETSADGRVEVTVGPRIGALPDPLGLTLTDLRGRLEFGPLATPEEGYELLFTPTNAPDDPDGGFPRRADVGEDGAFELIGLQEGDYFVTLLAPEDRGGVAPDLLSAADGTRRAYTHGAGDGAPPLDLTSTAGAVIGQIRLPALDEEVERGASGRPVRGALVRIERVGQGDDEAPAVDATRFRATRSDSEGRFVVRDLAPGEYRVSAFAGEDDAAGEVSVDARSVATIDLELR